MITIKKLVYKKHSEKKRKIMKEEENHQIIKVRDDIYKRWRVKV